MKNNTLLLAALTCICISTQLNAVGNEEVWNKPEAKRRSNNHNLERLTSVADHVAPSNSGKPEPQKSETNPRMQQLALLNEMLKNPQKRALLITYAKQKGAEKSEAVVIKVGRRLFQKGPVKPENSETPTPLSPEDIMEYTRICDEELPGFLRLLLTCRL